MTWYVRALSVCVLADCLRVHSQAQLHVVIENNSSTEVKGLKATLQQIEETRVVGTRNTETRERRTVAEERFRDLCVPPHGRLERHVPLPLPPADQWPPTLSTANVSLGYYFDLSLQLGSMFEKDLLASLGLALVPPSTLSHPHPVEPATPAAPPLSQSPRTIASMATSTTSSASPRGGTK